MRTGRLLRPVLSGCALTLVAAALAPAVATAAGPLATTSAAPAGAAFPLVAKARNGAAQLVLLDGNGSRLASAAPGSLGATWMAFRVSWTASSGAFAFAVDRDRNSTYGSSEQTATTVSGLTGQSLRYLRLYATADASSQAEVDSLVVNGASAGSSWTIANGSQTTYVDGGTAAAWTVTGRLRFPSVGSATEFPRVEVALGVADTTPPTTPGSLSATSPTSTDPSLSWTASSDAAGIAAYRVSRDGALLATVTGTSYTDAGAAEGSRAYGVVAVDNAGNASSPAAATVVVDRTPPAAVADLAGTPGPGTAVLAWTPAAGASSYTVRRDGTTIGTTSSAAFTDIGSPSEGAHAYTVTATDAAGNGAAPSSAVTVVIDRTPPAVPTGVSAGPTPTRASAVVTFTGVAGAARYRVYRSGTVAGETTATTYTDAASIANGTYVYTVTSIDPAGNESARSAGSTIVRDTTPPSRPSRPTAVRNPTNDLPQIRWSAVTGAVQYQVWRGAGRIALTTGTSFTESSAPAEGTSTYRVSAFDAAGNESARSSGRSLVVDRTAPPAPALTISASPSAAKPVLTWSSVHDSRSGVAGYQVYRNGTFVKPSSAATSTTSARTRTFTDTGAAEGTVTYAVGAIDAAGNESPPSVARTYLLDVTPPARPLLVSAVTPTSAAPTIVWPAVAGATGYVVRRGGATLGRVTATSYTDGAGLPEGGYAYDVAATDAAGNTSAPSDAVAVTIDRTPPGVVTDLAGPALTRVAPHLTYTAVTGAASYTVYRDGDLAGSTPGTAFDDVALTAEGAHDYAVAAVDAAGNEGARSATVTVTFDVTPPPTPALPTAASPTHAQPLLAWQASPGAAAYSVRRDGAVVGTTAATSFADATPAADGTYLYTVTALDAAGNESPPQSRPVAVTYDTTPPAAPTGLDGATPTNAVPALSWQPAAGAVRYRLQRDGATVAETAAAALSDSALVPVLEAAPPDLHAYAYRVVAVDAAGNESPPSDPRTIAVDLRSTENPTLLDAPSPTRAAPSLRWTFLAAAARYRVLRDGAVVGQTTTTTFSDTALQADGPHAYVVVALRADGSELGRSTPRTVVRDTAAPPAPAGVTAPAQVNRPPTISWDAVAEAVGYRVLRDGGPVGESSSTTFTDAALAAEGSYAYTVLALDAAGNASAPSGVRTVVLRTTPPAAPAGLLAASPTRTAPALSWAPVAGADHYVVRRGTSIVGAPATAAFADALPADGTYGYRVAAVDEAGNAGAPSATLTVVVDTTPPAAPAAPSAPVLTRTAPVLTWTPVAGATGYAVRRGGTVVARVGDVATFTDTLAGDDGTIRYELIAVDAAGNESLPSPGTDVVLDRTAPATPTGVMASSPTASAPYLAWGAVAGAVRYRILRGGTEIDAVTTAAFQDAGATTDGTYAYRIVAVDEAGNESAPSAAVTVVVDASAPAQVTGLAGTTPTNGFPALTWTAVPGAAGYIVYRDDAVAGAAVGAGFNDTTVAGDGSYVYAVSAVDAAGNEGALSATRTITVDTSVAGVPSGLDADSPANTAPELSWTGVPGSNVAYTVLRDGAVAGTTSAAAFTDTGLTADGSYAYSVRATDDDGVPSAPSSPVVVVYDTTPPATPAGVAGTTPTGTPPQLRWSAVVGAVSYDVRRDGVTVGTVAGTSFTDAALTADGAYGYSVAATDAAGNVSPASAIATVVLDTVPPAAPAGPAATSPTRLEPALAWTAVTGATSYQLYRGGTYVATTAATSYTDSGVPGEGAWPYRVVAVDGAGNIGPSSPTATVVYDVTAPVAPSGLTGPVLTGDSPRLTWTPVADAESYRVRRDGVVVATTRGVAFTDAVAGDGTVSYTVSAVDPAGNESAQSAALQVRVDLTPPPPVPAGDADPTPAPAEAAVDATAPEAPTLTATPDTSVPLGSGRGRIDVHVQAPADAVRVVVRRDAAVLGDAPLPAGDLRDDGLADQTSYVYTAIAYDAAGNASEPAHAAAETPDRTAPATPAAPTGSGYPLRLRWADEAGTTFTLERDGTPVARTAQAAVTDVDAVDAAPPATPTGVAVDDAGRTSLTLRWQPVTDRGTTYRYAVHGEDEAGNVGAASAAAMLVAQADDVSYRVLIDGIVQAETDAAHATLIGLPAGVRRTVTVVAVDGAGNPSDPSDALGVGRDEAPTAPTGLTGATPTADAAVLHWDAVADATGYVVGRDGHELARMPGTSYTDHGLTGEGVHAYTVAAVGAAGLVGDASAPFEITLDTTPPETTIADPGATTRPDLTLALGPAEPGTTFRCVLDEIAPADCSSPWLLQALATGAHRVTVTATDAAGNADATPASRTFTVDDGAPAAPSLTAVADEAVLTGSALGRVTVTAAPRAGGVRVVVTEGARLVLDAVGGTVTEDAPDGADLTYRAVAYDAVGNASSATSVTVHTPDRTAPEAPQITGAGGYPLTLHWTMEDGAHATVRRGGTTIADTDRTSATDEDATDEAAPDAPGGVVATGITSGGFDLAWTPPADQGTAYSYTATVRDAAGNVSPPAPAAPAVATSGIARYRVLVDGAQAAVVTAAHVHLDGFAAGSEHRVTVVAVDAVGNASARSGELPVVLAARSGTPPPTARILTEPVVTRPHVVVQLRARVVAGTAPVTAVTWRFADGTTAAGTAVDRAFRTTGTELVRLSAIDAGGGTANGSTTVVVDGRAPVAKVDGATPAGAVLVATDDLAGVESLTARWAGGSATVKGARLVVKLPAKVTTVEATARDRAGNVGTVRLRVRRDRVRPRLRVTAPALSFAATARITIRVRGARITVDGRRRGAAVAVTTGRNHVMEAIDKAGNRSRVVLLVRRDTAIAKLTAPALDGSRHDELWPGSASETGVRRYLLRAAELRLVIAGSLPASFRQTTTFTAEVVAALKAFQTAHHLTASGRIDAAAKAALDRIATNATIVWSDG